MYFDVDLTVEIAGAVINTVHSVKTKFDSTHIGSSCDIVVPLNCVISYVGTRNTFLTEYTVKFFKSGDPVTVTASMTTEGGEKLPDVILFKGYVYEFKEDMPCTIRCIDYLPLLGHLQNIHYKSISLKQIITNILKGTGITLLLPTLDLELKDITFRSISPWGILDWFKKTIGINISLSGDKLYVNLASNTLDTVKFSSDRNLHHCGLQTPDTVWQGYRVKAWFINNNGTRNSFEVGDKEGHATDVYFYKVLGGKGVWANLAAEALVKVKQRKYSGSVGGYLYPVVKLFDRIEYTDITYPAKSGKFVVTSISHSIDDQGLLVTMRWAFLTDFLNIPS